jgi:putative glutamine amidotransferase
MRPTIGITVDYRDGSASSGRYESALAYSRAVAAAGGCPVLLPHELEHVDSYVQRCDGLILTGGRDVRTEPFGCPTHPRARPMDPQRQEFELALLSCWRAGPDKPLLGICLGMQLMALHAGGRLNQHLPDILEHAEVHQNDNRHPVRACVDISAAWAEQASEPDEAVVSNHHQAVADPGTLRVVATAPDGVIEAVDDPARRFCVGVQWHPERGGEGALSAGLFRRLVAACCRTG